ncbi:MAG: hypothetical protein JO332_04670, partial [Planctomycetaceae bacterium]|nr:hypothetical protein [Planctomycetaceae bacterium]
MNTLLLLLSLVAFDGDRDNHPEKVRPIPLKGIAVPDEARKELEGAVADLAKVIEALKLDLKDKPALRDLLPDVQIFHKAVDVALRYDEFHDPKEFDLAR